MADNEIMSVRGTWEFSGGKFECGLIATEAELLIAIGRELGKGSLVFAIIWVVLICPIGLWLLFALSRRSQRGSEVMDAFEDNDIPRLRGSRSCIVLPLDSLSSITLDEPSCKMTIQGPTEFKIERIVVRHKVKTIVGSAKDRGGYKAFLQCVQSRMKKRVS